LLQQGGVPPGKKHAGWSFWGPQQAQALFGGEQQSQGLGMPDDGQLHIVSLREHVRCARRGLRYTLLNNAGLSVWSSEGATDEIGG
jgi:hypothetical protein